MRTSQLVTLAAVCGSVLFAGPALAASDYLLEIDSIKGEATARSPSRSVEVSSFSWGTSHAVTSPRDAASGMASGKKAQVDAVAEAQPVAADVATAVDSVKSFSLTVAEPGNETAAFLTNRCASGKHIPRAVLTTRTGRYELTDVMVTSCAVSGNQRKHELTGHVTLIK